jgi:hypothetical protein
VGGTPGTKVRPVRADSSQSTPSSDRRDLEELLAIWNDEAASLDDKLLATFAQLRECWPAANSESRECVPMTASGKEEPMIVRPTPRPDPWTMPPPPPQTPPIEPPDRPAPPDDPRGGMSTIPAKPGPGPVSCG